MSSFRDSDEEDNNPFSGTNHLYASGIAAVPEEQNDFLSAGGSDKTHDILNETRDMMMSRIFGEGTINHGSGNLAADRMIKEGEDDGNEDDFGADTVLVDSATHTANSSYLRDRMSSGHLSNSSKTQHLSSSPLLEPAGHHNNNHQEVQPCIKIIDAGQYKDTFGNYAIGYTISFNEFQVTRRYSEFDTLRQALTRLLPTVIIPPIPSKHPLIRYFLNPLNAENDIKIIDKRRRLLSRFLNNCYDIEDVRMHVIFQKFINPEYIWRDVLLSPPISILPVNNLLAPPLKPTKPSPLHLLLPTPSLRSVSRVNHDAGDLKAENRFAELEVMLTKYQKCLQPLMAFARQKKIHFKQLASSLSELGAYYNAFSLEDNVISLPHHAHQIEDLSRAIEKIGQAVDVNYVSSEILVDNIVVLLEEPVSEMIQFIQEGKHVLKFRKLKKQQYYIIDTTIKSRNERIEELRNYQAQMARLEAALKQNAEESPTIARAVQQLDAQQQQKQSQRDSAAAGSEKQWTNLFKPRRGPQSASDSRRPRTMTGDVEAYLLTEEERTQEIFKIEKELEKLNECHKLIRGDMVQVNESMLHSFEWFITYLQDKWAILLREFSRTLLNWLKDCLAAWQNARAVIDGIEA
ncbi:Snx41p Ecym_4068 [Eremothecium cymbalariae DBVPG|uniref:PX domain-containing protein n=1 Tax=Eremothecium cymbalariae (strain CBS 270.75 / DBVPG 7215 / KCTC 17166 / NRRL Y-17582) TaxID=931890 RepID=G8JSZ5_ERECY|nr:hypothetical protein Ecym_4068 [Eremothecium cymbalariae DBVPG\